MTNNLLIRYGGWATPEYTAAKVLETYSHNNAIFSYRTTASTVN